MGRVLGPETSAVMGLSWKWRIAPLLAIAGWFVSGWAGAPLWGSGIALLIGWVFGWQIGRRYFD